MKFRSHRAADAAAVDALIVPVFDDGLAPAALPRALRGLPPAPKPTE